VIDATILPVSFRAVDVAHFAAKIIVPESISDPLAYHLNMRNRGKREFIQALRLTEIFPSRLSLPRRRTPSTSARSAPTRSSNSSSQKWSEDPPVSTSTTIPICRWPT
jgi:hypothetical protein